MTFRDATDRLRGFGFKHREMAAKLGVSVQSIRQARLDRRSRSYRRPPRGWQKGFAEMATDRARRWRDIACELEEAS